MAMAAMLIATSINGRLLGRERSGGAAAVRRAANIAELRRL
jgi:hypothetical protein